MNRSRPLPILRRFVVFLSVVVIALVGLLAALSVRSAQNPAPPNNGAPLPPPAAVNDQAALTTPQQKGEPKKTHLEMTKADAAELSALADQLRDELNKMNVNVLPLDVIEKTQKVEKLAKKIKGEANGH